MRTIYNSTNQVRALASAVIIRAIYDSKGIGIKCGNGHKSRAKINQQSADVFLSGSVELQIWCSLAGIPYSKVVSYYKNGGKRETI